MLLKGSFYSVVLGIFIYFIIVAIFSGIQADWIMFSGTIGGAAFLVYLVALSPILVRLGILTKKQAKNWFVTIRL